MCDFVCVMGDGGEVSVLFAFCFVFLNFVIYFVAAPTPHPPYPTPHLPPTTVHL